MKIAVVGTGYVGLVTGACLAEIGHHVVCHDTLPERVAALRRGDCPIHEDGLPALIAKGRANGRLDAANELARALDGARAIIVAVGTPCEDGRIDLSFVKAASALIGAALKGRTDCPVVVVKSTVLPGTTGGLVRDEVERASGMVAGIGFSLAMNPEYLSQGQAVRDFREPDRIVIGAFDDRAASVLGEIYAPFACPKIVTSLVNAELAKYAANALQATLISYSNQIAAICEKVTGADEAVVMRSTHLDRIFTQLTAEGPKPAPATRFLRGGVGFGGSCFPKDLLALRRFASDIGATTAMLDATIAINMGRPAEVADMLEGTMGGLAGRTIAVLGLAFKPGTDDLRFSPGLALASLLAEGGATVRAHDPLAAARDHARTALPTSIPVLEEAEAVLKDADAALIVTAWPDYAGWDWARLGGLMRRPLVLDGRDIFAGATPPGPPLDYRRVGVGGTKPAALS